MKRFAIRRLAPSMVLLFTLGATAASAGDFAPAGHRLRGTMRMLSRLDLTEAQKSDIRRIFEARGPAFLALRERARTDRQALRAAAEAEPPNTSAVGAAFLKVRADRKDLRAERRNTLDQVRAVLTPAQRERLDEILQARRDRRHRAMARPGGPDR